MAKRISNLKECIDTLKNTHFKMVQRKVCVGAFPAKKARLGLIEPWQTRRGYPPPPIEDQWYDEVEELDQTHADRRLELANELTQLVRFTAYCRTSAGQHHVALPQVDETALDEERIEEIRQANKARYGRPPQPPEPPAAPRAPNAAPKPPAGPRAPISRHPPEEQEL